MSGACALGKDLTFLFEAITKFDFSNVSVFWINGFSISCDKVRLESTVFASQK